VTHEILRLGAVVRERLEEERDWLVRGLGFAVLAATYLQTVPLLFFVGAQGEWLYLDGALLALTSALGIALLAAPRWIRDGFTRLFRLRPPPLPAPSSVVAEAIRQVQANEAEVEEISTLATVTSIILVVIVTAATILGVIGLFATLAGALPALRAFVFALVGLGVAAAVIVVATVLLVRWRHHSLRELDRENAWRWGELHRIQREFWQRY
jgi:hypothetical protein